MQKKSEKEERVEVPKEPKTEPGKMSVQQISRSKNIDSETHESGTPTSDESSELFHDLEVMEQAMVGYAYVHLFDYLPDNCVITRYFSCRATTQQ
jgi:hypothetical protein